MIDQPVRQRQMSIEESRDKGCVWSINDSRAQVIHKRIGEMIALDNQPFLIVEDEGFKNLLYALEPRYDILSRRYTENLRYIGWHQARSAEGVGRRGTLQLYY